MTVFILVAGAFTMLFVLAVAFALSVVIGLAVGLAASAGSPRGQVPSGERRPW